MIVVVFFSCSPSKMLVKFWGRLPSCRSTHWCILQKKEKGGLPGPLAFTWKRCEVYAGFFYHGPEKGVCVCPALSCVCPEFLHVHIVLTSSKALAFSEELFLRSAHVVRGTGKLGGSDLYTGCLLLTFLAIHEKNTPNTWKQDSSPVLGSKGRECLS